LSYINAHPDIRWNIRALPPPPGMNSGLDSILEDLPHDSASGGQPNVPNIFSRQMSKKHRRIANE